MTGDLIKWLREEASFAYHRAEEDMLTEAADRIEALEAEVERLQKQLDRRIVDGIHTCHDECPRLLCVERRENERLREALEQFLALIKHQYFGSREAMNALQEADNAARAALGEK